MTTSFSQMLQLHALAKAMSEQMAKRLHPLHPEKVAGMRYNINIDEAAGTMKVTLDILDKAKAVLGTATMRFDRQGKMLFDADELFWELDRKIALLQVHPVDVPGTLAP